MGNKIKVASIQMDCRSGKVKENLDNAERMLKTARERGAALAVLPELFNVGYQLDMIKGLEYSFSETIGVISQISRELNMYIAAGVLEKYSDRYYNSLIVYDNRGELIETYRKINLFSLSNEKDIFLPGNQIKMFKINDFKFGLLICYDLRFPELSRKYFEDGCSVLMISSAFPFPRVEHWNTLLRARAVENCLQQSRNRWQPSVCRK
jgi:predicted amidohydrolase